MAYDGAGLTYPLNVSRDCSLLLEQGRMLSVTGTVFLPGGPSSFTIRSLKYISKHTKLAKQKKTVLKNKYIQNNTHLYFGM